MQHHLKFFSGTYCLPAITCLSVCTSLKLLLRYVYLLVPHRLKSCYMVLSLSQARWKAEVACILLGRPGAYAARIERINMRLPK